jgi:hypothetical protein
MKTIRRSILQALLLCAGLACSGLITTAQKAVAPVSESRVINSAKRYLAAAGERITKPGLERGVHSGRVLLANGQTETIQWAWEFPGKLRLDRQSKKDAVNFDPGKGGNLTLAELEDELLEALSADTTESFFDQMQSGMRPRLLGLNFKAAGAAGFGSEVDIFEVAAPVVARSQKGASVKHFHFDSLTGLLARVVYQKRVSGKFVVIRTEYSRYELAGGQRAARQITRFQGDQRVFQIDLESSQWQSQQNDGLFAGAK